MNGLSLHARYWLPEGEARAALALVHGIGDHSGRWTNVAESMVGNRYAVFGYDLRGHGKSPGKRGHINSWEEYRVDLLNFRGMIRSREPGTRIFLYGHSLGALIVLDAVLRDPKELAGAIVSAAPLEPVGVGKPYLVVLGRILSRIWPSASVNLRLDRNALSRISPVVASYERDPLVHGRVSARWGTEVAAALKSIRSNKGNIRIPFLMIHGEADRINSAVGAKRYFDRLEASDKEFILYPGAYHTLHNDLATENVLRDVLDWMNRRLER